MSVPNTYEFVKLAIAPYAVAFRNEEEDGEHTGPFILNLHTGDELDFNSQFATREMAQEMFSQGPIETLSIYHWTKE